MYVRFASEKFVCMRRQNINYKYYCLVLPQFNWGQWAPIYAIIPKRIQFNINN